MNKPRDKGTQAQKTVNPNPYAKPAALKCYRYNQPEHRFNECLQRKTINITTREEEEDRYCCALDGEDDDFEDEKDEQINCVVRRMMLALKQEDDSQRNQLC